MVIARSSEPVAGGGIGDGKAEEAEPERKHQNVHGTKLRTNGLPHGTWQASAAEMPKVV